MTLNAINLAFSHQLRPLISAMSSFFLTSLTFNTTNMTLLILISAFFLTIMTFSSIHFNFYLLLMVFHMIKTNIMSSSWLCNHLNRRTHIMNISPGALSSPDWLPGAPAGHVDSSERMRGGCPTPAEWELLSPQKRRWTSKTAEKKGGKSRNDKPTFALMCTRLYLTCPNFYSCCVTLF